MTLDQPVHLKVVRSALNLTQRQLASALGFTGQHRGHYVSAMERGARPIPRHISLLLEAYFNGFRPENWNDLINGDTA